MPQFSFDIVSEYDIAEMNNVVDQTVREIRTRYDLKDTSAEVDFADNTKASLLVKADDEYQLNTVVDIIRTKLAKRSIDQSVLDTSTKPETGNPWRWNIPLKKGISSDDAKKLSKQIRELGLKKVSTQIQGDQLRVTGPSKDDLQSVMAAVQKMKLSYPVQFQNFR